MKKVLSLVLAVVLVFGLSSVAFAWNVGDIVMGESGSNSAGTAGVWTKSGNNEVRPGEEVEIELGIVTEKTDKGGLTGRASIGGIYTDDDNDYEVRALTKTDVRTLKLDVKTRVSEGSKVIDSVGIEYRSGTGAAYIKVEFIDPFVSTKEQDFDFLVYLTQDKSRTNYEWQFIGTLENETQLVDENDDYVYVWDVPLVEAEAYVKAIEVDLGEGISIHTKMFDGKKYYGYVTQEVKAEDDDIVAKYPAIDTIYYLSTINLNSSGNHVKFDLDDKMYVYNADLEYIGTTADKLPYSTKYYIASVELDVESADIDTIPNESGSENVPGGGDDVPTNVNENPGTGR